MDMLSFHEPYSISRCGERCLGHQPDFLILRAATLMLAVSFTGFASTPLKIGVGRIVPISYRDANGNAVGFAVDVVTEAARREKITIQWIPLKTTAVEDLETGRVDLVSAAMVTEERKQKFYLSDPWWSEELDILSRGDSGQPKRLGVQHVYVEFARSYLNQATFVLPNRETNGADVQVTAVCKGTLDGALITHGELHDLFLNRPAECNGIRLQSLETPISYGLSIMSRKSDEGVTRRLRKRIDDLVSDGTLLRFAAAHPPIPTSGAVRLAERIEERYRNRIWMMLACSSGLLIAFLGWFLYVRHKALARTKRSESELRAAHQRLTLKQEIARLGSFEWFPQTNRLEWTPEMEQLFGFRSPDRLYTLDEWKALVHPDDVHAAVAAIAHTVADQQETLDLTYRIVRPGGKVTWIHSRSKYTYDAEGKPLSAVGVAMDITDLKRGEMAQEILGGLLQVCSACRRIQDSDTEEWYSMEGYLRRHIPAKVSHGMCPDCGRQWFAESNGNGRKVRQS